MKEQAGEAPLRPMKPPWEIYVYGVWVTLGAIAALATVATALVLTTKQPQEIALVMGSVASPIVAIASAYFGISAAGRAAAGAHDVAGKAVAAGAAVAAANTPHQKTEPD